MFEEFRIKGDEEPLERACERPLSREQNELMEKLMARRLSLEERRRLELLLLQNLKQHKSELQEILKRMSGYWTYEDHFYRFYHGSWKVYVTQGTTEAAVNLLRKLLPEREFNMMFAEIIRDGTGKEFHFEHNDNWQRHTRPILEAFAHAKFMIEMAVRYADLTDSPVPLPIGWAALLYLCDLR